MTTAGGSRERRYVNVEGGKCVTCPPMVSKRYPDWKLIVFLGGFVDNNADTYVELMRTLMRAYGKVDCIVSFKVCVRIAGYEISIQLLEEGVGSFDVLQRSLPSIVLCRLEKLDDECTPERLLKMFRIAQLQIEYILKSQAELASKIDELQKQQRATEFENSKLRREMSIVPEKVDSLFKCDKCDKLFLRSCFLYDHIRRRHKEGEFPDGDNSVWK
ncbi:Zinc finger protein DZIP1 [Toxocara canis]|uniref:Zinc finger protein DZIP1 n=1 Tax=Toxocara canis TaxID=6265 RepID=A0A0B2V039_TOXCA|nr:Zinc finger protein DZIP1 [Toxocara canis]